MLPIIPKPAISRKQKAMAITVAGAADLLQLVIFPVFFEGGFSPFDDGLDILVAVILIAICGFRWQFVLAFLLELVPGLDLLPTWTAVALLLRVDEVGTARDGQSQVEMKYPPIDVTAVAVPPVKSEGPRPNR